MESALFTLLTLVVLLRSLLVTHVWTSSIFRQMLPDTSLLVIKSLVANLNFLLCFITYNPESNFFIDNLVIITNFNQMHIAFRVHTVVGISRISWQDIQKPDKTVSGGPEGVATGIAQCGEELVTILDFEKIVAEIAPETGIQLSEVDRLGPRSRNETPIWVAEDSILLTQMIRSALVKAGYVNLNMYPNGGELWDALQQWKGAPDLREHVALIITDLEMPQMDGHRLTKLIKCDPEFSRIPVVIFSSLITEEMRRKGKEVGADEQLSKPEIGHLIGIIDQLIARGE